MAEQDSKLILEYEKKIEFLENKLSNILKIVESTILGDLDKARNGLANYKESTEYFLLEKLVEKAFSISPSGASVYDEKTYLFIKIIIESLPFPVFIKDEFGKYLIVNGLEASLFDVHETDIIGKHDSDFVTDPEEMDMITKSDEEVLLYNRSVELPKQSFSLPNGRSYIFKTHKIPFGNPISGRPNILGFSIDVSDSVNLEKLKKIMILGSNPFM